MPGDDAASSQPAIVMVASNLAVTAAMLPAAVELGRTVSHAGGTFELVDERMSKHHATVRWDQGSWVIRDLDSRNGTYVNAERIHGEVKRRGDVALRLGHTLFILVANGSGHPGTVDGGVVVGPELARVYDQIRRLASGGVLLVQGGAGIGKQLAARVFHAASPRAAGPFTSVNCGSLQGVADRLLFGGKKGVAETIGHLQMARGGTLYLSSISELDPAAQATLVKLLAQPLETNIVCAGHDLRMAVTDGALRADLYERLAKSAVTVPLLRARRVDLVRLIQLEAGDLKVHPRLIEDCLVRPWPGHVRELRAAIRQAAARALEDQRDLIRPEDLADAAGVPPGATSAETAVERKSGGATGHDAVSLAQAMRRANGSLVACARALNLHRAQLAKLLEEHGIPYEGLAHDD